MILLGPVSTYAAMTTDRPTVGIQLFGDDHVSSVQVANNSTFSPSETYDYSPEKSMIQWNVCFPATTCSGGLKTVYVRYLDSNRQVLGTATQQVDYQKPTPKKEIVNPIQKQPDPIIPPRDIESEVSNSIPDVQPVETLVGGCTDPVAKNYTVGNDYNDGSCVYQQHQQQRSQHSQVSPIILSTGVIVGIMQTLFLFGGFGIKLVELPLMITRFFSQFLIFIGARKKPKHWGSVIDSVSGAGLDPAVVTVFDQSDHEIKNTITDIEGRFGFLIPAGSYRLTAQKTHYQFPADHGYRGEWITMHTDDVAVIDIPLKNIQNDWNEQEKKRTLPFWKIYRNLIHGCLSCILVAICIYALYQYITYPTLLHGFSIVMNGVFLILSRITRQNRSFGLVYTKENHQPVSGTLHIAHTTTPTVLIKKVVIDDHGRYYCLLVKGDYTITVFDRSGVQIHTEQIIARNGILKKDFTVTLLAK